jgi:multidrug resistance efflux pump
VGLLLLVVTAAGAGWVLNHNNKPEDTNSPPRPSALETPPPQGIVCFGYGDSDPSVANLYPVQPGRVVEVVTEGATVKKGDLLLRVDSRLAQIEADRAESDLEDAKDLLAEARNLPTRHKNLIEQQKQAIAIAETKKAVAQQELDTARNLRSDSTISKQTLRGAEEQMKAREAEVKAAQLKLKEMQLKDPEIDLKRAERAVRDKDLIHRKAKLALEECTLRAPSDGTVLRVLTQVGETLGSQGHLPAIEFCPQGPRIVRAEVMQEWAGRVKEGETAVIEDDTHGGIRWTGKVKHVSDWYTHRRSKIQEPFQYNDVRTLECLVTVDPGGPPLRIGQRVRVTIQQGGP